VVLIALVVVASACGSAAAAVVRRWPKVDPSSPRATATLVEHELEQHSRLRRFVRARVDPTVATGLVLSAAIAVVIVGFASVGVLVWMVRSHEALARFDRGVATWGGDHATDLSTSVLKAVTQLGSTIGVIVVAVIIAIIEMVRRPARMLPVYLALVVLGQNLIANTVKVIVDRARPDIHPLAGFSGPSFPSGHAAAAAATYAACALVLGRARTPRSHVWLAGIAVGIATGVATSRVLLGVHWLTDVLAGLALGWGWFALCSIAFGGRLLRFGAPVEAAERVDALSTPRSPP
jgi:undecaprenyl-diphosphatase